jgi:hypothetical protein
MTSQEIKNYPSPNTETVARRAAALQEYKNKLTRKKKHQAKHENQLQEKVLRKNKACLKLVPAVATTVNLSSNTPWSLTKTPAFIQNVVDWTLEVVKGKESDKILTLNSSVMITNRGCGKAVLANVVSNLQVKNSKGCWKTISTNLSNIHERNSTQYTEVVQNGKVYGYTKNHASISVDLLLDSNSAFSISPTLELLPEQTITLDVVSKFNASCIHFKKRDEVRVQNIISFSNVLDGKKLTVSEYLPRVKNVASYVSECIVKLPMLVRYGQQAVLSDPVANLVSADGATFANYTSFGEAGVETLTDSQTRHVTVTVNNLGMLSNKATLTTENRSLVVSSTVDLVSRDEFKDLDYLTLSAEEWSSSPLLDSFDKVYPAGWVTIGTGNQIILNLFGAMDFLSQDNRAPGVLTQTLINPLTSVAGDLAVEVLALRLNLDYNNKELIGTNQIKLRDLIYKSMIGDMLNSRTVSQILSLSEGVLGGSSPLPPAYSLLGLTNLLHNINSSFVGNQVSSWAIMHLHR